MTPRPAVVSLPCLQPGSPPALLITAFSFPLSLPGVASGRQLTGKAVLWSGSSLMCIPCSSLCDLEHAFFPGASCPALENESAGPRAPPSSSKSGPPCGGLLHLPWLCDNGLGQHRCFSHQPTSSLPQTHPHPASQPRHDLSNMWKHCLVSCCCPTLCGPCGLTVLDA